MLLCLLINNFGSAVTSLCAVLAACNLLIIQYLIHTILSKKNRLL